MESEGCKQIPCSEGALHKHLREEALAWTQNPLVKLHPMAGLVVT